MNRLAPTPDNDSTRLPPAAAAAIATTRLRALTDLLVVLLLVVLFFVLAATVELSERIAIWARGYEYWQVDELPLTIVVLALALAWFGLRRTREAGRALDERIRAEARVAELLAHNRDLAQRLILAQETERRTLARELHDEVGQCCTAIRADALYIRQAPATDADGSRAAADRVAAAAESLHMHIRDMLRRLRPAGLDSLGLEAALQELCETWEEQTGIACAFFPRAIPVALDDATSIALLRLVQEGLTNVARHAGADQVRINLCRSGDNMALSISDNGNGVTAAGLRGGLHGGLGLLGMRERVAGLHGTLVFPALPGTGFRIEAQLPLVCQTGTGSIPAMGLDR